MEAYSFWCSTCKKDHAGECAPKGDVYESVRLKLWPSVGSRWWVEPPPGYGRPRIAEIFTVESHDVDLGVVVGHSDINPGRLLRVEIEAWWEPTGGRCVEAPQFFWCMKRLAA